MLLEPGERTEDEQAVAAGLAAMAVAGNSVLMELIVALHDIGEVLSRPTLARLAKIGRVAEQVAGAATAGDPPGAMLDAG